MPPTFVYAMCLMAYLAAMTIALVLCALLFLVPSKRRVALRLCLAVIASLPGILLFQFFVGIVLGVLLAAVLGFYAAFHPPEWVQWVIGIPTILIMFLSLTAASLLGCYTGGRIGWLIGGGTPPRVAISEQPIFRLILSWLGKRRA
jgi:hypothetical protein